MKPNFDPKSVAFALMTYYPRWYRGNLRNIKHTDKLRGDLALKFIRSAINYGYQVAVADGKSSKVFLREVIGIKEVVFKGMQKPTRSPGKRKAIREASKLEGVKVIMLLEPEKVSIVEDCVSFLVGPILENKADIVIAKRDEDLFKNTYPSYMYQSEKEANNFYNEVLRVNGLLKKEEEDLDMFFAPRVFRNNPKIIALFMKKYKINIVSQSFPSEYFNAEEYSNTLFFPIILALKKRLRVKSVTVPFSYPEIQKENEENAKELFLEKRKAQRVGILIELLHFITFLDKGKGNKIRSVKQKN